MRGSDTSVEEPTTVGEQEQPDRSPGLLPTAVLVLLVVCVLVAVTAAIVRSRGDPAVQQREVLGLAQPPGLARVGMLVDGEVGPDGEVEVVQWVRTDRPVSRLRVAVRDVPGLGASVRASDVKVAGGRIYVDGPRTVTREGATYRLAAPTRLLFLSYRLTGVADTRSTVPGRALLRTTSLEVTDPTPAGPARTLLRGAQVLSAACLARGRSLPDSCGGPVRRTWRVDRVGAGRDDTVQAQVDLRKVRR